MTADTSTALDVNGKKSQKSPLNYQLAIFAQRMLSFVRVNLNSYKNFPLRPMFFYVKKSKLIILGQHKYDEELDK